MSDAPRKPAASRLRSMESNEDCNFNDDHDERSSLVAAEGIEPVIQTEHYQSCLKLYVENKITKENAWNLHLINYMRTMLLRHDPRMENIQTAATVLDACARIYGFRVDSVHADVLKIAGNLTNTSQGNRRRRRTEEQDGRAADGEPPRRRRRKRPAVPANPTVLDAPLDTVDYIDPLLERSAMIPGDITASHKAFNAILDVDETMAFNLRTDVPFLEPVPTGQPLSLDSTERVTIPTELLPRFTAEDVICRPFADFIITARGAENEDSVEPWSDGSLDLLHQTLVFNVEAQVEPIPQEEPPRIPAEPLVGIAMEEDNGAFEEVCVARQSVVQQPPISEMRPRVSSDRQLEYAYSSIIEGAWAGPAHWRLKNNVAAKPLTTDQTGGHNSESGRPRRKKPAVDFIGAGMAFDARAEPTGVYAPVPPSKITLSNRTLVRGWRWNEKKYKRPVDLGLEESHFDALYLRRRVTLKKHQQHVDEPVPVAELAEPMITDDPMAVPEPMEIDNEDDNAPFCANALPETTAVTIEEPLPGPSSELEPAVTEEPEGSDEDLLEPPAKRARIMIPYATRPKQLDMNELKKRTWKVLTKDGPEGQEVRPTTFSSLLSELPSTLTPAMRESVSMPLAFLSVLHLATEQGLKLEQQEDLKDFGIRKNDN